MSGSTARKVQPFTINTRLSLPKCAADFPGDACPGIALASALDSHRGLRRSINERISLYLAHARAGPAAPAGRPRSPGEDGGTDEDRLNRSSLARSIKKITLSNWYGDAGTGEAGGHGDPARAGGERNHNNNNSRTGKAQFKVFLRKDVDAEDKLQEPGSVQASVFCSPVDRCSPFYALAGSPVSSPQKESPKGKESAAAPRCIGGSGVGAASLLDPSPLIAQFNREMLQAESWVRGKLRDLKDGCDLQDWEEVAQTLQRDMKDFENTLIKLNQMGEQLMWRASPSAEAVRRQLLALQDQWQLLKQTAASQSKALGGLRSLQDFNRKAERLEAWIKHKEEKPSLAALLQESPDKIQLTRRILDLKQEEQQFQSLHKELNSLAQKLEKQSKSESRNISARRKHLNKTWLRLQGTLKEHHEALQLALEVASFLQQAEILLGAIHAKQSSICSTGKPGEGEPCQDRDVRDIASQVMMLDVAVSQLLNLQPSLAARVTSKHRDVKESWAQLQQALRRREAEAERGMQQLETQMRDVCQVVNVTLSPHNESVAVGVPPYPAVSLEAARVQQEPLAPSTRALLLEGPARGRPPGSPQVEAMLRELGELWEDLQRKHQENGVVLQEIDKALKLVGELDQAERWLQAVAGSLLEPAAMRSPAELRQDLEEMSRLEKQLLLCGLKLQALREEAAGESPTEHEGARKMQRKVEMVEEKLAHVQAALRHRAADLRDSLVLSEFLQDLQEEEARSQQGSAAAETSPSSEDMSRPLGELQEAVEMLNDAAKERERVMEVAAEMESLERLVAKVSPQLEALQCRAKALSQDIALAENSFTTVKSEKDLQGLQSLLSCQQEMEHAVSQTLQGQLEELERAAARLQELCPARQCPVSRELQETLRAWAGLRELLQESRLRVQQASQLRSFFKDYLAMISWTEDTRAQIFSESPSSSSLPETPCEELERRIEEKLKEFEALAAAGQQLVSEEHYLSATIKERLEELQSMLGWVLVRWRAQRHQQDLGNRQEGRRDPESLSSTSPTGQVQAEARKTCTARRPPAVVRRPPAGSGGMPAVSHTLPKAGAGCLFNSLQRREQARAEQAQLLTLQGIMGDGSLRPAPQECHGPSNTWPQKCGWRKGAPRAAAAGPQLGELLLYVRNPLVQDIDAECGAAPQNPCPPNPKITCPRVSLGSVLSLELPRDAVVLGCRRGAAARQQETEEQEQRQDQAVRPWKPAGAHGVAWQEDGHRPQEPSRRLGMSPKSEQGTWFEEVSFNRSHSQQRAHCAGKEHWNLQRPSSTSRDLPDSRPSRPSHVGMGDELTPHFGQDDSPTASGGARHHRAAWLELGSSPSSVPGRAGAVPSPACAQQPASSSQPRGSPASPAAPTQLSVFEWALGSPQPQSPAPGTKEVCHPAHRQFEEEEEELQAIWDGAQERWAQSPPGGSCASRGTGSRAGSLPSPSATAGGPLILSSANNVLVAKFTLPTTAQLLHSPSGERSPGSGSPRGLRVSPHVEELVSAAPVDASSAWDQRRHGQEERESSKASCRAWGLFHAVLMRQTLCFYQDRRDSLKSSVVALPLNLSGAVCTPDAEYTKKTNCFRLQLQDGSEYLLRAPTQALMNEWVSKLQQNSGFPKVDYFQAAAQHVEGTGGTGSFSKVSSPGTSHLQGHHQVTATKSQEIVVLPCASTLLQRPLGSQDGPVGGTVAAAENAQGTGHKEQQWSPRASPGLWDNICPEDDYGLVANKRRSYSFTSATYQKITPVAVPREPVEAGSSYSVTLYIGEQVSAVPRARCHSFVARTGSPKDTPGEKTTSPPRTKNKSVFKKFFGKKE
ncbi:hypothetical protein DUI87_10079 [Hirundo rustica rustica]|uniref:PH domain-containing protein n=1 Tax=Hirundo rustica rustica TaxID=333673 RepID=A0A3M0KH32_HIRRU|nr:hypothetical protein DUI87_10079 [Hirundo rustica rustica]